jgi:hypothetical protein
MEFIIKAFPDTPRDQYDNLSLFYDKWVETSNGKVKTLFLDRYYNHTAKPGLEDLKEQGLNPFIGRLFLCKNEEGFPRVGEASTSAKWIKEGSILKKEDFHVTSREFNKGRGGIKVGDRVKVNSGELMEIEGTVKLVKRKSGIDHMWCEDDMVIIENASQPFFDAESVPLDDFAITLQGVRFKPIPYFEVTFQCGNCGNWH